MQAYCMKCRAKKEMKDAKSITMKNGKAATQGVCPSCGTKMFRIGKAQYKQHTGWKTKGWVKTPSTLCFWHPSSPSWLGTSYNMLA